MFVARKWKLVFSEHGAEVVTTPLSSTFVVVAVVVFIVVVVVVVFVIVRVGIWQLIIQFSKIISKRTVDFGVSASGSGRFHCSIKDHWHTF
jgi:hypothetical protein